MKKLSLIKSALSSSDKVLKGKKALKTFNNVKITLLCGFITILVLRGTIGFGGAPDDPPLQVGLGLSAAAREASRVLAQADAHAAAADGDEDDDNDATAADYPDASGDTDPNAANSTHSAGPAFRLGPKISDWDQQRRAWLHENPELANAAATPRILLVTGSPPTPCDNPVGDHYLLKSIKNKIDYCRLHGIEIFYGMAHMHADMAGYWSKLPLLRKLMLVHPEIEWFWWMDSDAMFTDMSFELPLHKYADHNLVLHGWEEEVYIKKAWVGLNTGSFLLRNCQWSLDLLDAWAPMGPRGKVREDAGKLLSETLSGRPAFEADDQSALIYLLSSQNHIWADKVFLENSYYLHGYWVIIVEMFEEVMAKHHPGYGDERWPFVTHFVGCKPCGQYGDYSVERCLKQMERSFNFGDNQVLHVYGFEHNNLGTFKVKRIRNETANPLQIHMHASSQHKMQSAL